MSADDEAPEPIRARTDFAALALFAAERPHRRRRARPRAGEAARQPDPLPRHGGRGRGRAQLRLRRGDARRAAAAHGAALAAALPELRRPLRAARRRAEPDRRDDDGGRRGAGAERRAHRRAPAAASWWPRTTAPRCASRWPRSRAGHGAHPGGRRRREPRPTRPRSSCRSGRPATTEAFATYGQIDDGRVVQPVQAPDGVRAGVRRPGGHDLLDRAPGPDRRRPLPRRLPLRVRGAALLARPRGGGAARRAGRLPGRGPAEARGDRGGGAARPRPPARAAERRRRLRLLAPGRPLLALRLDPRRPRPRPREGEGLPGARRHPRALAAATSARSSGTSRPSTARTCAARSSPTRSRCGRSWATPTPAGPGRSCARRAWRGSRSRRSAGSCPSCRRTPRSSAEVTAIRRRLANGVTETAAAAHFAVSYGDGAHLLLHSDRRADAILLEALIADQPRSDLIPKLVAGPARPPHGRALDEHAGERVRPPRPRPLLPGLREDDARLRGPRLARRALRGLARVPRPHHRAAATSRSRCPTSARPGRARTTSSSPRRVRGGSTTGSACATRRESLRPRAARPRLHRRALLRGRRRPRRTCGATTTAPGASAPAPASACG